MNRTWRYAAASGAFCALALIAAMAAGARPAVFGAAAASFGALCAFSALAAAPASTNGVLGAFVAGFLCRALLVGVGLVASGAHGSDALTYVFTFFALYAATQVVEVLFVRAHAHGATP